MDANLQPKLRTLAVTGPAGGSRMAGSRHVHLAAPSGSYEMKERIAEASPRFKARIAGVLSLLSLLAAVFGEFFVRRLEFAGDLIAVSGMVAVTLLLYDIFKPVNRGLSLLAASFNLVGLTFGALRWNPGGVDITVVFGGLSCLLIGYLIFRSTFLPRILGALMAFAGLGWVTFLSPPLADYLSPYNLALGLLGQESVMLWLLVMGVNVQRWKDQASATGSRDGAILE
jgi:uncharacterized protein DUF4386